MKLTKKISVLTVGILLGLTAISTYATTNCPDGKDVKFNPLATPYVGYFSGVSKTNQDLYSVNYTFPHQFITDGYTLEFFVDNSDQTSTNCVYHVIDNVTHIYGPNALISSNIHR